MEIIPAIDLKSGRCVRLYQGDYQRETIYSEDPISTALRWQAEGAPRLHLVDLDGAARGEPVNHDVIRDIFERIDIPVQVGGGIRTEQTAKGLLDAGADRVVLGTAAVRDPNMVKLLCEDSGADKVVVAVDSRSGQVAIQGWTERTSTTPEELVRRMAALGARRFLYTDISRDGTLTQPNFGAIQRLVMDTGYSILASGGIASTDHILHLAAIGVDGAVVGKALYTGAVDLRDAILACKSVRPGT